VKTKEFLMLRPILACFALSFAGAGLAAEARTPAPQPEPTPVATQKSGVLLDKVVAVVNDGVVTQGELEDQIAAITERLRESKTALPADSVIRSQVLERLVIQEVQLQKADRSGIKVPDEELNAALTELAEGNKITYERLPSELARQGIEWGIFREDYRKEITMRRLRQREVIRNIRVTPRELDQFIERIKRLPDPDTDYDTSHILLALPPDATPVQVEEMVKRAEDIIARARTEEFSALAVANSNSADALEGGALGWRKGPALPTIFLDVVVGLKPGEISKPLVDANGVHLVRLNDKRSALGDPIQDQVHARHILLKTNELQDDATVQLRLAGIRDRVLKGEDFAVFASSMSEDKGSAATGGDLEWKGPGSFVPIFEAEVAKLGDNEISPPFRTEFGWHIVQVLGRRKFDVTEDMLRDRAYEQLVESRAGEETELWLRRLRDEAYVETSM
jgi:peptidyl-prolyl cis-trans isomerase SurA